MTEARCTCGQPTAGAWLCAKCQHTLRWALVNVGSHYVDLDNLRARTHAVRYDRHRGKGGTKELPLPVDIRFADRANRPHGERGELRAGQATAVADEVRNTVTTWTRIALEEWPPIDPLIVCDDPLCRRCQPLGAEAGRRQAPADTVPSCCHYLARMFDRLLTAQWAPEMLDELLDCERRLKWLVDVPMSKVYLGCCTVPFCEGSVYAREGEDTGRCNQADCRMEYDTHLSRQGLEDALDARLCTAAEIAELATYLGLRADRQQVRKRVNLWHSRGRIIAAGHDGDGSPTFQYGHVRGLLYVAFSSESHAG